MHGATVKKNCRLLKVVCISDISATINSIQGKEISKIKF